ncbi:OsmC family protein [Streptomyces sp. NPDC002588]|uniref:OsmC family protein n=1 Tax=Streptomyces sp. NPDC002588 TaxID=3154419 RepID=UPI0033243DC0
MLITVLAALTAAQAANLRIPLDSLEVEVQADHEPRAGRPGFDEVAIHPRNISYTVRITSPAGEARIRALHETVERKCPIYSLLDNPQSVTGRVVLTSSPRRAGVRKPGAPRRRWSWPTAHRA